MVKEKDRRLPSRETGPRPDLTDFDFEQAALYRTRSTAQSFRAEQLQQDEVIVRSWGVQEMKKGDWVVFKPDSKGNHKRSGVKKDAFEATYVEIRPGEYQKQSYIRAAKIDFDYLFMGIDSDSPEFAPAGTYIVLNCDRYQRPIIVNGRRDIFFYREEDIERNFEIVANQR